MNRLMNILAAALIISLAGQSSLYAAGVKTEVKKGNLLYNKGKFDQALKSYEQALSKAPDSDVVNFNTATALYKTKQFEAAARHFEKALLSDNKSLQQKAQYNLGNAQYKYGIGFENSQLEKAVSLLESSLSHYERAMNMDPQDEDARFNREFVEKELARLKQKLQKQQSQQKQGSGQQQSEQKEQAANGGQKEEQKQQQQAQQQAQEQGQQQKQQERQSSQPAAAMNSRDMSEQEARMLLRGYKQQEEPQGLYQQKPPVSQLPEPEKDW